MIVIEEYTANWDGAVVAPRVGTYVRIPTARAYDGREWDGFSRVLKAHGKGLEFVRANSKSEIWKVVRVQ